VQELFVGLDGIRFVEVPGVPSVSEIEERVGPYASSLPDGFKGEVNAGIGRWARQVSRILARGFVLTVDYGHKRAALYSPERRNGTLRTYYRHTLGQDPFRRVGAQDMTTHVDFTAVDEALAAEGFDRAWHTTQREFLLSLGLDSFIRRCHEACTTQSEADTNRAGMLHLTKPEGMGAFRVAIHSRGVTKAFAVGRQSSGAPECLPVPLLRDFKPRLSVSADLQPQTAAGQPPSWEELFSDRREGGAGAWTS
jgi:SAM-dependent MidA family methyltransferase